MKKNFYAKNRIIAIFAAAGLIVAAGCAKTEGDRPEGNTPMGSVFDFTTRTVSTLAVQYDVPKGYRVYFEVYAENPEYLDADGQIVKKTIEPIDAGFTDENGSYNQRISVMSATDRIYIYSPYAGVPRILTAEINADGISQARLPEVASQSAGVFSRADTDYKNAPYNTITGGNLQRLGYWLNGEDYLLGGIKYRLYGRPDYLGDRITVSADILSLINQTLPEGGGVNSDLIKNGDIRVTEPAHVDVHLIDEQTSANSTLAYYCYDTQNPPKSSADISDIIIVFPNSKVLQYHGWSPSGNNGALERGEGARLHYWKNGEDMGDVFPENTSIGWVIYNQSYAPCNDNKPLNAAQTRFFGAANLNSDKRGHVALFRSGDKVIFGFEDWTGDYDYNDVVFYVKSDPIDAIIPEIPEIKPEVPSDNDVATKVTYRGILTFEDIWPYRGDFDMNDVVVRYESTVGYNTKNEVLQTNDKFTILHSGAMIDNSFAYQLDVRRSEADITITSSLGGDGGAYVDTELDRATVRLANNVLGYANLSSKAEFQVATKYMGRRLSKADFTHPPYNSFITTTRKELEVHLTNQRPTESMNKSLLGTGHDRSEPNRNLYYVTFDDQGVQMPFAIDIAFDNAEELSRFSVMQETKRIDTHYPGFLNWVKTNGKQDKDWYLNPKK